MSVSRSANPISAAATSLTLVLCLRRQDSPLAPPNGNRPLADDIVRFFGSDAMGDPRSVRHLIELLDQLCVPLRRPRHSLLCSLPPRREQPVPKGRGQKIALSRRIGRKLKEPPRFHTNSWSFSRN